MNFFNILKKTLKAIYYSFKFYFKIPKHEALLASLPRSGTHLTFGLVNLCYSMKLGFPGTVGVIDNSYSTFARLDMPLDERSIFKNYSTPQLWHSHLPYSKIVPLRKKFCKTIVLIREPLKGIKSFLLHELNSNKEEKYLNNEITMEYFMKLETKYNFVSHYSNFLNSWRKRKLLDDKNQILILDNKFITQNTFSYIKLINNFFEYGFSEFQMKVATEQLDIERIKKMSTENSSRITKKEISFSKEIENYINKKCEKEYLKILKIANNDVLKK